ncbi:DUF7264 domain-containing protein [Rhodococcus qingshengii]
MPDIRKPTPVGALNLPTIGDFERYYQMADGTDFPPYLKLYFLLGDPSEPQKRWNFTVTGGTATLVVESEEVAQVPVRTKYWLMLEDTSVTPTRQRELQTGAVKKVNA